MSKAVEEKLKEQIKDVGVAQSQEVPLFWCGVAENVQVMGSFDGWSHGEHLSPEYTGSHTMFSTTLMLRPGSSGPIKFVIDRDDSAAGVIKTALKLYAREGRLPVLGSDINNFVLYPADAVSNAMKPSAAIGSCEVRKFVLCKARADVLAADHNPKIKPNGHADVLV
ncbi:hypothetical protein RD792_016883, partial [Penstemon davidsonii]